MKCNKPITILVADDDEDDKLLLKEAIDEVCRCNSLQFAGDGQALLDYLHRRGGYADSTLSPRPDLILMDLRMPGKDGLETLRDIKSDPDFKAIPIIILTGSEEKELVSRSYGAGANSYIVKPVSFDALKGVIKSLNQYWCDVATLPPKRRRTRSGSRDDGHAP